MGWEPYRVPAVALSVNERAAEVAAHGALAKDSWIGLAADHKPSLKDGTVKTGADGKMTGKCADCGAAITADKTGDDGKQGPWSHA